MVAATMQRRVCLLSVLFSPTISAFGIGGVHVGHRTTGRRTTVTVAREATLSEFAVSGSPQIVTDPMEPAVSVDSNKSILLYLPGIELTGYSLSRQVDELRDDFEVRWLAVPQDDRTSFDSLGDLVSTAIEEAASEGRTTFVVGESFGGVLALSVALRNPKPPRGLAGLALVNPATSIDQSWASKLNPLLEAVGGLPPALSEATYAALATPLLAGISTGDYLADPLQLGRRRTDADSALPSPLRDLQAIGRLSSALPELTALPSALPLPTLAYRLTMLQDAAAATRELKLSTLKLPVDVLSSTDDKLLPSTDEGRRLARALPNGRLIPLKQSGHVPLLEARVSLRQLLRDSALTTRGVRANKDYVADFAPPSAEAFANASASIRQVRQLTSPVFLSTAADGRRLFGLGGVPRMSPPRSLQMKKKQAISADEQAAEEEGTAGAEVKETAEEGGDAPPVLFIGNHQLFGAFDLPLLVEEMYLQVRGCDLNCDLHAI